MSEEENVIELRMIDPAEARKLILDYIEANNRCLTSDIIFDLALDPDLVLRVLSELEKEGKVTGGEPK